MHPSLPPSSPPTNSLMGPQESQSQRKLLQKLSCPFIFPSPPSRYSLLPAPPPLRGAYSRATLQPEGVLPENLSGGVCTHHETLALFQTKICDFPYPREDKGVRELIPHIGPIPILIPLKLFLEGIEFTRIMLPRASRVS